MGTGLPWMDTVEGGADGDAEEDAAAIGATRTSERVARAMGERARSGRARRSEAIRGAVLRMHHPVPGE